jgi:hypothetical protein
MNKTVPTETGLKWAFTDKPVTPWGGLRLVQEMLLRMRLREALQASGLPSPGSNRGYDPVVMLESFLVCVWIGGTRFSHTAIVRFDKALCEIFGWKQVAEVSTFTRFFRRFKREEVDGVFDFLGRWFWDQLSPRTLTLDLDSSVITRFGNQEGTAIGYNRQRRGSPSHEPFFAFVADLRMVLHTWLRPGNAGSSKGVCHFFSEALGLLGDRHKVGLVRADAGFYDGEFLEMLESRGISYVVVGRKTGSLKSAIENATQWLALDKEFAVAEFEYECQTWEKKRRFVTVRQKLPSKKGDWLLETPAYSYRVMVTDLKLPPAEVWRLYNARCDSENRIAELKNDFGISGFCLDAFYATEAALRAATLAYNLMSLFRQAILQAPTAVRLPTMKFECFALGAWIGRQGHDKVLRISLARERRPWFEGLFTKTHGFSPPWLPLAKA